MVKDFAMKTILPVFLFFLTGCAAAIPQSVTPSVTPRSDLPDLGLAPELTNTIWLNTSAPLHLAGLHGKVVLLEMWTFDCINCRHTIPQLNAWYKTYASQGLIIIGNHFPEFPVEADLSI